MSFMFASYIRSFGNRARSAAIGARARYSHLKARDWLFIALPLWFATDILISIGPEIQQAIFAFGDVRAPSVYEAAHGYGIVKYPDLLGWLSWSLEPIFLAASFAIILFAAVGKTTKEFAIRAGVACCVILFLIDAALGVRQGQSDLRYFLSNLLADAAGGIIVGLLFVLLFYVVSLIKLQSDTIGGIVRGAISVSLSFTISMLCYLLTTLVYQPTVVRVEAEVSSPNSGMFLSGDLVNFASYGFGGKGKSNFSFFPAGSLGNDANLVDPKAKMSIALKSPNKYTTYTLKLSILVDCMRFDDGEKWPKDVFLMYKSAKISQFSLKASKASMVDLDFMNAFTIEGIQKGPSMYWLGDRAEKNVDKFKIETFVDSKDVFTISSSRLNFAFSTLLVSEEADLNAKSAIFETVINGRKHQIILRPSAIDGGKSMPGCTPFMAPQIREETSLVVNLPAHSLGATLRVEIDEAVGADGKPELSIPKVGIAEASGWLSVHRPVGKKGSSTSLGDARMISFEERGAKLRIDGTEMPSQSVGSVYATGALTGELYEDGRLMIRGVSDAIWSGNRRLNPTRWERLATELQVALLGVFGFLILASTRALYRKRADIFMDRPFP